MYMRIRASDTLMCDQAHRVGVARPPAVVEFHCVWSVESRAVSVFRAWPVYVCVRVACEFAFMRV